MEIHRKSAFTLLELSIVVVIIGLITAMGVVSTQNVLETSKRSATDNKMNAIEKALMDFRLKNNRLPCPADSHIALGDAHYGEQGATPGECSGTPSATLLANQARGAVPVKTLGLPDEFMIDGWGRRFVYVVGGSDSIYPSTYVGGMGLMPMDVNCGPTVNGDYGSTRSSGLLYGLISHGVNGYGAFLPDGTQIDASTASAEEQYNATSGIVQKDATLNFDDIVRFKERWQMQNSDDGKNTYTGPTMLVGDTDGGTHLLLKAYYPHSCSTPITVWGAGGLPSPTGTDIFGAAFTAGNKHVVVYSSIGCNLIKITGRTFSDLGPSAIPGCSAPGAAANNAMAMSKNGYLAVTTGGLRLWRQGEDYFGRLRDITGIGFTPTALSFTNDAHYLLVVGAPGTTQLKVYSRDMDNGGFTALATQPSGVPTIDNTAAISPDGKYLVVHHGTSINRWSISSSGAFTALSAVATAAVSGNNVLTFSPDSRFLSVGTYRYTIDPSGAFTPDIDAASTLSTLYFSADDKIIAKIFPSGGGETIDVLPFYSGTSPTNYMLTITGTTSANGYFPTVAFAH